MWYATIQQQMKLSNHENRHKKKIKKLKQSIKPYLKFNTALQEKHVKLKTRDNTEIYLNWSTWILLPLTEVREYCTSQKIFTDSTGFNVSNTGLPIQLPHKAVQIHCNVATHKKKLDTTCYWTLLYEWILNPETP